MPLQSPERILLIGDHDRQVQFSLAQAVPNAFVTSVSNYFDGIAELSANRYSTVMAAVEPIERRPETAVRTLRQLSPQGRVLLFGHPTLEPLSRKMLDFGIDDYLVTPAGPEELNQLLGTPPLRIAPADVESADEPLVSSPPSPLAMLMGLPLAEMVLESLLQNPQDAAGAATRAINARIQPTIQIAYTRAAQAAPTADDQAMIVSHPVRGPEADAGSLHLVLPKDDDTSAARHFLAQLAFLLSKLVALDDRHARLQKLAITDELTGLYNARYFRHFLTKIIEKARQMKFPVTLLLFDIDDFKKYNDAYGHGVGDEILKQTASLMRRCCREHDLVARIGGDEFAVVFWEKEGPRQPREPRPATAPPPARVPQTPLVILNRFRKLLADPQYSTLGATGKGTLTISGGLAVYPFDASSVDALIQAADTALMFGAKAGGKNSIYLIGQTDDPARPAPTGE